MALTIGELVGYITMDTRGVETGITTTEVTLRRLGSEMTTVTERAGHEAGDALGTELATAAETAMDGVRADAAQAGNAAGDAFGNALEEGAVAGAHDAGEGAGTALGEGAAQGVDEGGGAVEKAGDGMFSKLKMAAIGAGVLIGGALVAAVGQAMEQGQIQGRLGAQLGASGADATKYGHVAGKLYANAVTEDFQGAADAIKATMSAGLLPTTATEAQIQQISTKMSDFASTFELDVGQAANAVGQVMKNKLAPDAQTALDVMTRGMQVMGPRADDLADTFNEYSPIFAAMGYSAQQATGLLAQGMKAGARDTDTVADAIKEFSIRAIDGSQASSDGFKALGLDAEKMTAMIAKGGASAGNGMQIVLDKIRAIKDPVKQNAAAVALFGTKSEDMRAALLAIDPKTAVKALGDVGGAADRMGESLRNNAGTHLEQFKRQATQAFVDLVGGKVIPHLNGLIEKVKEFKSSPEFDKLVQFGHTAWEALTKLVGAVKDMASNLSPLVTFVGQLAGGFLTLLANIPPKVLMEIATALGIIFLAVKTYTTYVMLAGMVTRAWAVSQGILNAVMMLNPVGLVIAAIVALIAIFVIAYKHSDTFREIVQKTWQGIKDATAATIEWLKGAFQWFVELPGRMEAWGDGVRAALIGKLTDLVNWVWGLPGRLWEGLKGMASTLWNATSDAFNGMKTAAYNQTVSFLNWVRGIPGMIANYIGDLGYMMYNKGQDLIYGLWNGIKSMGQWLKQTLIGWALQMIPGPIAKALGINSPSKVMAAQVGKWIPAGVVAGIESGQGALDKTMSNLIDPTGVGMSGAGGVGGMTAIGGSGNQVTVRIELAGPQEVRALIRSIVQKNGGDVQKVFT